MSHLKLTLFHTHYKPGAGFLSQAWYVECGNVKEDLIQHLLDSFLSFCHLCPVEVASLLRIKRIGWLPSISRCVATLEKNKQRRVRQKHQSMRRMKDPKTLQGIGICINNQNQKHCTESSSYLISQSHRLHAYFILSLFGVLFFKGHCMDRLYSLKKSKLRTIYYN